MIFEWAVLAAVCMIGVAIGWLLLWPRGQIRPRRGVGGAMPDLAADSPPVWLFDGMTLLDRTSSAAHLTPDAPAVADWEGLCQDLEARFAGLPASPKGLGHDGPVTFKATDPSDRAELTCEWLDGITRLQLQQGSSPDMPGTPQPDMQRTALDVAPYPVWHIDPEGMIDWRNAAYETLALKIGRPVGSDDPPLFPFPGASRCLSRKSRVSITIGEGDKKSWFDCSLVPQGDGYLCYAVDINAVVDAETAQRNFVQTLAKTFAQLPIGLAIFDRNRQLALFNPALIDLTALPADFLSARPNILSFFDRLRDHRMMPEPKNYASWRHQIADLLEAATDGRYQETWSLPSGSVYSVNGRPHPDGAVAFLFEDITAEITLTRRFRSELEMGQSILDHLGDAIAVFAPDGTQTLSNSAYHALWNANPETGFAQTTVLDATRIWQDQCKASPLWGEFRDFVTERENRAEWTADIETRAGTRLACTINPIQSGATLISFRARAEKAALALPHDPVAVRV